MTRPPPRRPFLRPVDSRLAILHPVVPSPPRRQTNMLTLSARTLLVALALAQSAIAFCYSARALKPSSSSSFAAAGTAVTNGETTNEGDWVTLAESVRKIVLEEGSGELPQPGSAVELEYTGTLRGRSGGPRTMSCAAGFLISRDWIHLQTLSWKRISTEAS